MRLEPGAVVVVTGAAGGIGAATAVAFARRGCRLALGDVRGEALRRLAGQLEDRHGAEAVAAACDVRDEAQVRCLVAAAVARWGRLDVMVNNAGAGHYATIEATDPADFTRLLETNVLGVLHGVRSAAPLMRRQGRGHIAIVGSVNGKVAWPYHGAYSATKHALSGLAQSLRMELAGSGVTSTLILPVNVETGFFRRAASPDGYAPRPLGPGRYRPADVARLIIRSVERPSPEVNLARPFRVASTLAEAAPWLADASGGWWYRRTNGRRGDIPDFERP
jgi:NAD(P)-dependent dehydrogenase (short-subunit alcohol dehydrogenase family)